MREEEAGTRYLSPLVKQDLAKLDSDAESRQLALKSLKQFIELLDATSMPKFLAQIAESREPGGSRSYAISLYEEVARVHRRLVKPYLPRVMSSLLRALAASGSSPQLQQACAKVTAAMARYTIDSSMCIEDAEEIIRDICDPLAEALAGKLEPLAAGAAACIHALIETENWKYACDETVQEVCQRTSVALCEKTSRTVFHLQLASALASMNPDTLSRYGATLLRAAEEILKTAVDSWQHRRAAAKLLQGVLTILDEETLKTEVDLAIHALENCRLDKMPHVRTVVSEALYVAKMLASGESTQFRGMSCGPLSKSICKSVEQSYRYWTKGDIEQNPSLWTKCDESKSPVLRKRIVSPTSQESNQLSFSPASISTVESMHVGHSSTPAPRSNSRRSNRTPLYPARGMGFTRSPRYNSLGVLSPSGSSTDECEFTPQKLDAKENIPARMTNINGAPPTEELGTVEARAKSILQVPVPFAGACNSPTSCQQFDHKISDDIHTPELKAQHIAYRSDPNTRKAASKVSNPMVSGQTMSPVVSAILDELTETASSILAEDNAELALLDSQIAEVCNPNPKLKNEALSRFRVGSSYLPSKSGYAAASSNSKQSLSCTTTQPNEKSPSCPNLWNARGCMERCEELEKRGLNLAATDTTGDSAPGFEGNGGNSLRGGDSHNQVGILKHHYEALAHLNFSPEKTNPLITAKDFVPFAASKRSVGGLEMLNSSPHFRRVSLNQSCQDDGIPSAVGMDVETSSEAGWSVRDNPIASDESFQAGTSNEEELGDRRKPHTDGTQLQNNSSLSPRDIHMLSPCLESRSVGIEDPRPHQENTSDSTLYCVPSNILTPISAQAHDYMTCDNIYSVYNTDTRRFISSAARSYIPIIEGPDYLDIVKPIPVGAQHEDEVKMHGLRCNCQASSEGSTTMDCCRLRSPEPNPERWWDSLGSGQYMLVRLVSRNWRNLCGVGEILLGGTLCVVLTLPLAMAIAKTLASAPEYLVPT